MKKKLFFLLVFIFLFNISYAFNVPYQFLYDYNYDKLVIKSVDTDKTYYYLCEIKDLKCSNLGTKEYKLNFLDVFYSPDKSKSVFQIKNNNSYLTFLYLWPFIVKNLPVKEKIVNVVFDQYKLAIFTKRNLIIISTLDENILETIDLPNKGYKFRISKDFKDLIYFKNNNYKEKIEIYLLNLDNKKEKILVELNNSKNSIGFVEFIDNQIFFTLNNNFTEVYLYDLNFNKLEKLYDENFLVDDVIKIKNKIYFVANKNNPLIWFLYEFDPQTKITTTIYEGVAYEFKLIQMGDYLIFKSTGELPPRIIFYNLKDRTFKNLNLDLKVEKIKTGEIIKIENIYSVLLKPDEFNSQNEYSLIIWLHGGPMRQTSIGYHSYFSYGVYDYILENLRRNNYLIVKIDYPGSWGYGKEYQDSLKNNIGKLDVESVLKVVNYLKDNFKIKNIHLIGNSYGGYLSLKVIYEQPNMFNTAISINGVSDWWTLIKRIPSSIFMYYFKGVPDFKNKILYDQASIFLNQKKLKNKKIILIYGTNDKTIPNEQTILFYEKYKNIADVKLLELNDNHSITKKENLEKILNFILKELK